MTAELGEAGPSDADLVAAVLTGDREAFGAVYDRYGDRLYDYAYSMLRRREEAEDAVADSFVLVAERLGQLRDPDRLRPWLYSIVRSQCLRRFTADKRVAFGGDEALVEMAEDTRGPEGEVQLSELQALVWSAADGLAERDRSMLDLHLRHGLEGAELGEAMGVSASNAYVMLSRLRGQVDRSIGALLIARLGRDDCPALDGLLADWDGTFSPLVRKRVARHVDDCEVCSDRRRVMVSPLALLAGVPMLAAPLTLRDRVMHETRPVAFEVPPDDRGPGGAAGAVGSRRRHRRVAAAVVAALVLGTAAVLVLWPTQAEEGGPTPTKAASGPEVPRAAAPVASGPSAKPKAKPTKKATTAPVPGRLTVSTRLVDLGGRRSTGSVLLTNAGEEPLVVTSTSSAGWLSTSGGSTTLAGGAQVPLRVAADRSAVGEGTSTATVTVATSTTSVPVTVRLREERDPVVGRPSYGSTTCGGGGRTVRVTAPVDDESDLRSVVLSWSGPSGSGRATMRRSGGTWTAGMGPFPVGGDVTSRVTATDSRGNSATGPARTANVDPCPQ